MQSRARIVVVGAGSGHEMLTPAAVVGSVLNPADFGLDAVVPAAFVALSLYGVISAFGAQAGPLLAWTAGIAAAVFLGRALTTPSPPPCRCRHRRPRRLPARSFR